MAEEKPGWYYVGDGHLRYIAADGWTDQYTLADGDPELDESPDDAPHEVPGPPPMRKICDDAHVTRHQSSSFAP